MLGSKIGRLLPFFVYVENATVYQLIFAQIYSL